MRKELRILVQAADAQGWRVEQSGSGHYKFFPPDPAAGIVVVPATPHMGNRSWANTVADLRRAGMILPGR